MEQQRDGSMIDHQVTYVADAALIEKVHGALEHHRVVKRTLRTNYFDTPQRDLKQRGITVRERWSIGSDQQPGTSKVEAKIPTDQGLLRVSGPAARVAISSHVSDEVWQQLRPVASQIKQRRLMLVGGSKLSPDTVVALDEVTTTTKSGAPVHRMEIEAQMFTALPWTKKVDRERVHRFRSFCEQLELTFGLERATSSGYLATHTQDEELDNVLPDPLDGFTVGAKLRTETLFSGKPQLVVDASHVQVVSHEGLDVVPVREVFADPNTTFIGFGKPNVFLAFPSSEADGSHSWRKFAAFMFWRKPAHVADTKGRVQGGVFFELNDLPPHAVPQLREAMRAFEGKKTVTCANATAKVMGAAGFTSQGEPLGRKVRPLKFAEQLWNGGLEFEGLPVTVRIVRTTPATVSEHFTGVLHKEATSLFRLVEKLAKEQLAFRRKKATSTSLVIQPRQLGALKSSEVATGRLLELRVGHPTKLAVLLRHMWGDHPIFEAVLDPQIANIDHDEFRDLHQRLRAYPGPLSMASKLKRYVLFSRPVVALIRGQLATQMDSIGSLPAQTLVDMFQVGTATDPFVYNVILTGTSARMCRLENRTAKDVGKANWVLAKHVLLSGYDPDVRFAGEIWADEHGALVISNDSGTYKPSDAQAQAAARFLEALTGVNVSVGRKGVS